MAGLLEASGGLWRLLEASVWPGWLAGLAGLAGLGSGAAAIINYFVRFTTTFDELC